MNPRVVAAFFLMLIGAAWLGYDVVVEKGQADWHMGTAVLLMLVGAIFTEPKELAPAFRTFIVTIEPLIPGAAARRRRKSSSQEVITDNPPKGDV